MRKLIIAIDGYSSTGKSTLAKLLAKKLGYAHIDSGAMYRAITLYAMENGWTNGDKINEKELIPALKNIDIRFQHNALRDRNETYLNGKNAEDEIRRMDVSSHVSFVAKIPEVREYAVALQREMTAEKGVVMDGRDIGTTVFPHADLKIFLTASAEVRAQRRYAEMKLKTPEISFEEVLQNVEERDRIDTTRTVSPLKKAEDAIEIDNSHLSPEETVEEILNIIKHLPDF